METGGVPSPLRPSSVMWHEPSWAKEYLNILGALGPWCPKHHTQLCNGPELSRSVDSAASSTVGEPEFASDSDQDVPTSRRRHLLRCLMETSHRSSDGTCQRVNDKNSPSNMDVSSIGLIIAPRLGYPYGNTHH